MLLKHIKHFMAGITGFSSKRSVMVLLSFFFPFFFYSNGAFLLLLFHLCASSSKTSSVIDTLTQQLRLKHLLVTDRPGECVELKCETSS